MSDQTCPAPEEQSFGEALAELDRIVAQLEGGQLELEESMDRYERGVGLLKSLQARLADAQQKVTMLMGELEDEATTTETTGSAAGAAGQGAAPTSEEVPF
ncbi:MAG TPA: exodeoxyribonuclease VII small subunit [Coriobacteriia bacterium]